MARVACLLDGHRGIYIPRDFAADFVFKAEGQEGWEGCKADDLEILRKGPDEEFYWEAWDNVLQSAFFLSSQPMKLDGITFPAGTRFALDQDGDLWACDDREEEE